jgi:hypothetical protein
MYFGASKLLRAVWKVDLEVHKGGHAVFDSDRVRQSLSRLGRMSSYEHATPLQTPVLKSQIESEAGCNVRSHCSERVRNGTFGVRAE